MEINIGALRRMLRRVNLGGLIGECVIEEGKNGLNHIQAIDLTNSLFLSVTAKTKFTDFEKLGIGDLSTICKYLETADDETEIKVSENRIVFKGKTGTFKYLLSQPDMIPTIMEDKEAVDKLVDWCTHEISIEEEVQKTFLSDMGLTKTNSVSVYMDGKNLRLLGGLESEHQFNIKMGEATVLKESRKEDKKITIPIFGSHLGAVLSVLDWTNNENLPKLMIKEGKPIVIKQNKDTWCLTVVEEK